MRELKQRVAMVTFSIERVKDGRSSSTMLHVQLLLLFYRERIENLLLRGSEIFIRSYIIA